MARRIQISFVALLLVMSARPLAQDTRQVSVTLKAAQAAESIEQDLPKAIGLYEQAVKEAGSDRALVARILLLLAEAQAKAGRASDARATYERIVREHADSGEAVATARARLREQLATDGGRPSVVPFAVEISNVAPRLLEPVVSMTSTGHQLVAGGTALLTSDSTTTALRIQDLATGKTREISTDGGRSPVMSPDSSMVAYLGSSADGRLQLKLHSIQGPAKARVLVEGQEVFPAAWSSRRNALLAKRSDRTGSPGDPLSRWSLVWVSLTDGSMTTIVQLGRRITGSMRPVLSPDEQCIAYAAVEEEPKIVTKPRAGHTQVYVTAADGSSSVQMTQTAGANQHPVWTPDGKRILFTSDRLGDVGLWSMPVELGKPGGEAGLLWGGLGATDLVGVSRAGALYYLRDRVTPPSMLITRGNAGARPPAVVPGFNPAWSPDGRALAFLRPLTSLDGSANSVVVRDQGTGAERLFNRVPLIMAPPRWFNDGRRLLVATRPGSAFGGSLPESGRQYLILDTTTGRTTDVLSPDVLRGPIIGIAPDDATLLLLKRASAGAQLDRVVAHDIVSGRERETLTLTGHPSGAYARHVTLSPDGKAMAFVFEGRGGGQDRLGVAPAATGVFQELAVAEPGSSRELQWSGDGRHIYWTLKIEAEDEMRVMRQPATGGPLEFTGFHGRTRHVLSPDGRSTVLGGDRGMTRELWILELAALLGRGVKTP